MKPVCIALDTLQGENNCFLGLVLPVIVRLKRNLNGLILTQFETFRTSLLERIEVRFGHLFRDDDFVLAAATHPKFKLSWLVEETAKLNAKLKLKSLIKCSPSSTKAKTPEQSTDYFDFGTDVPYHDEIDMYLADRSTEFSMLNKYPNLKEAFFKYNTPIPSSAPVERLFSIAALILTTRHTRLKDELFEELLLLKISLKLD